MIVPSIDVQNNTTVQLVGGKDLALDAGDPAEVAKVFSRVGEMAVIDLDAAMGLEPCNQAKIRELVGRYDCRVGGGIRSLESARAWLDAGATKVILGTAAKPEMLRKLPKKRVIAALDARNDEVVVQGWTEKTGSRLMPAIESLRHEVGGFLITRVEREGKMGGIDLQDARRLRDACAPARLTLAGGVATAQEVAELDALGVDTQVGMALYTGRFTLAQALESMLRSDRSDGLWPTVVCDVHGVALGLAYSSSRSLAATLECGDVHYESRRRGLWKKGESSGATQRLVSVSMDCDRDALRFLVRQRNPGFCHLNRWSCFEPGSFGLPDLSRRIEQRMLEAQAGSYTARLLDDPDLLADKILEEAKELVQARTQSELRHELADLVYFSLVRGKSMDVGLEDLERELAWRARKVSRRSGDAKPKVEVQR